VSDSFFAIVNPAAGGGKCRKLVGPALERLRSANLSVDVKESREIGDATRLAREAWQQGYRKFIAVGGDGTSYEIVNGIFPQALEGPRPTLSFLPLGTGNSFLRDFPSRSIEQRLELLSLGATQPVDVIRLAHSQGTLYYINLLSMGFAADVAMMRTRNFSGWGELGYQSSIFICLARFRRRPFPLRVDGAAEVDRRRCLFLTFNNTKFTGGTMMIAPNADSADGLIEYVRWGPIGRIGLIRNLPRLYDGTHVNHPLAERRAVRRVDFEFDAPVDVMIDGETMTLQCQSLDVLPSALNVVV
jgi:diacylglycerol kinase (ATP)